MRKSFLLLALLAVLTASAQKAKYVFYFIGDGMGANLVNCTETYLGALEGRIGIGELCFASLPFTGVANTQSADCGVTDSAAAGTALATGFKTNNGYLGVLPDLSPVTGIAQWAHDAGAAVGVTTSVSVDHATPAAFYAHVQKRGEQYVIGTQLVESGFDFFAGSDFVRPDNPVEGGPDLYAQAKDKGYTIAKGYKNYRKLAKNADKMILFQSDAANKVDHGSLPYAIDKGKDDLSLADVTRAAINFLVGKQGSKDGLFLMVEGGKIDYACHANDTPAALHDVMDFDQAVRVAYEFYQQHPDETLIVVTADHETGGLVMGSGGELPLENLRYANMSVAKLGRELHKLHDKYGEKYSFDVVKNFLSDNFGLWTKLELNEKQNNRLETAFNHIAEGKGQDSQSLYQKDDELADAVKRVLTEKSNLVWASSAHSAGYVPVFAVGVGAENFTGRMDNTDIPKRMAQVAGWRAEGE